MVSFGPRLPCTDAEPYYYDYLSGLGASIPEAIVHHIRCCAHCAAQIRQLEAAIAESEAGAHGPNRGTDVIDALSLHFAHLGEEVTCAKVKPFLPALLLPSLEVRIPTPITVHVDGCRRCREDMESLRELELRPGQLARLSRLYAALPDGDSHLCRQARAKTWAFACACFEGIDPQTLDHMCVCPRCRRRVYRRRERILAGRPPGDTILEAGLCGGISTTDLFEWVVPYRRSGDLESSSAGEDPMPSHVQACPECIERMQALHRTIYGIAERVDSGVSTVYTTATGARQVRSEGQTESLYGNYPIHVATVHPDSVAAVARVSSLIRIGAMYPRLRPVMRAVLLAAAVIPLAIVLFTHTRSASGVSMRELSNALRRIENLHVVNYGEDATQPTQEIWVSRASGWVVMVNTRKQTLFDNKRRVQRAVYLDDGTTETTKLEKNECISPDQVADAILRSAGTEIPADRESQLLTREPILDTQGDGEGYELTWEGKSLRGGSHLFKVRVFLDSQGRPNRAEYLQKTADEERWRTGTTKVFDYPSREKLDSTVTAMFGNW
ncbi:MAG: hypothetical protein JW955_23220 [Sedimentisphaerales bacterium]|nr:hypothetical protein [Sedimentisphaerales bacterium]